MAKCDNGVSGKSGAAAVPHGNGFGFGRRIALLCCWRFRPHCVTDKTNDKPHSTARAADGFNLTAATERAGGQYAIGGAHLVDILHNGEKLWHGNGLPLAGRAVKSMVIITLSKWKIRQEERPPLRLSPKGGQQEVQPVARAPRRLRQIAFDPVAKGIDPELSFQPNVPVLADQ
jgi:hypothetical protein